MRLRGSWLLGVMVLSVLAGAFAEGQGVRFWASDEDYAFLLAPAGVTPFFGWHLLSGDLNGDGAADLVVSDTGQFSGIYIYFGPFAAAPAPALRAPDAVIVGPTTGSPYQRDG